MLFTTFFTGVCSKPEKFFNFVATVYNQKWLQSKSRLKWRVSNKYFFLQWGISPLLMNWAALYMHFSGQEVNSKSWVTWLSFAHFVYFLREMCLLFNFWMIKFTIMCFLTITYIIWQYWLWSFQTGGTK